MKATLKIAAVLCAAVISTLTLIGCQENSDDGGADLTRRLTVAGLPAGHKLWLCHISSYTTVTWGAFSSGNVTDPFYENAIGTGGASGIGEINNQLLLSQTLFEYKGSSWQSVRDNGPFKYSGYASVWLTVEDNTNTTKFFGINNVQFANGRATINWNPSTWASFVSPP
ncbi:MAG: hypothetical protein LBK13_06870 [Spirochaetales bacterium]|nr:hypothetical protein [Spirochaetales bacterium]